MQFILLSDSSSWLLSFDYFALSTYASLIVLTLLSLSLSLFLSYGLPVVYIQRFV